MGENWGNTGKGDTLLLMIRLSEEMKDLKKSREMSCPPLKKSICSRLLLRRIDLALRQSKPETIHCPYLVHHRSP
jgi:hypothetical protein